MTTLIDLSTLDDPRDGIHRAVQAIVEGGSVSLPLRGQSVVCRLATTQLPAVPQDRAIAGSTDIASLVFRNVDHAADFLPPLSAAQAKVLLRSAAGAAIFDVAREQDGPLNELASSVGSLVGPNDRCHIRIAGHPITEAVLSLLPAPLVAGPTSVLGEAELELTAGDSFPEPSASPSVIGFVDERVTLERSGMIGQPELDGLLGIEIVFICTGNTCRSPMAEVALRQMLAQHLGVDASDLAGRGISVRSAGLAAGQGQPASRESVRAVADRGWDLTQHQSQPATFDMLANADAVFTMTQGHRATILSQAPDLREIVETVSPDGRDVDDPIGAPSTVYERCLRQIESAIQERLPGIITLVESTRQQSPP